MRRTVQTLESIYEEICRSSYPLEWDENHVSFQLMTRLRQIFGHRIIHFTNWSKIVDWQSFKNRGKQETHYGDIALLVNIQFSSGETLKGVACLEAKRSYSSGNYESMDLNQLSALVSKVPYSHLLLYDHEVHELQLKFPDELTWRSHFWVSPINTATNHLRELSSNANHRLLRTSFPFSMFLTGRIFWGFDLDFREEVYEDVATGITRLLDPSFLGIVNVYYDHQKPIDVGIGNIWEKI